MIRPVNNMLTAMKISIEKKTTDVRVLVLTNEPEIYQVIDVCSNDIGICPEDKIIISHYSYLYQYNQKEPIFIIRLDSVLGILNI